MYGVCSVTVASSTNLGLAGPVMISQNRAEAKRQVLGSRLRVPTDFGGGMATRTLSHIRLGMTGLEVSPIAFGTWQLGGEWGEFDHDEANAAIRQARDLGINLFDTAFGYGFGASEKVLGEALRHDLDKHREEVIIATKGGLRMTDDGLVRDSSAEWIRDGVESSLGSLGVDYVDLFQIHWPDPKVPFAETAGALQELVDAGKIRHIGVSNFDESQIA